MVAVSKLQGMYEEMVTARHYEERLQEEYLEGKQPAFDISAGPIPGELHLAAGHEASGAGVCQHLRDDDTVTAPHRPHHIAIAKGVDLKRMTAEIFGRETGLSKGKAATCISSIPTSTSRAAGSSPRAVRQRSAPDWPRRSATPTASPSRSSARARSIRARSSSR